MTPTEQANVAISELRRAYAAGRGSLANFVGLGAVASLFDDAGSWITGTGNAAADRETAYNQLGTYIEEWAGVKYIAAKASNNWAPWFTRGNELRADVASRVGINADASAFNFVVDRVLSPLDTVGTAAGFYADKASAAAKSILDPANWPIELKIALGVAAAGVAIWTIANLATIARVVKP